MTSDIRAAKAREHHRLAAEAEQRAGSHRMQRNRMILSLRAEDRRRWTYTALAAAIGCSPKLVAYVCRTGELSGDVTWAKDSRGRVRRSGGGGLQSVNDMRAQEDRAKGTEWARDPWDRTRKSAIPDGYNNCY